MAQENPAAADTEEPVETTEVSTASEESPPAEQEPQEPSQPDPARALQILTSTVEELREELKAVRVLASEATTHAKRAQSTADARARQLTAKLARAEADLDAVITRDMDPAQLQARKMQRELEELKDQRSQPVENGVNPSDVEGFRSWLTPELQKRGIKPEDPVLREAFNRHVGDSADPAIWRTAAGLAIAEVVEKRAEETTKQAQERERLAREQERARAKQAGRRAEGPIDRGQAAGSSTAKDVWKMTDKEFEEFEREKDRKAGRNVG